jgi:hypothetical protein
MVDEVFLSMVLVWQRDRLMQEDIPVTVGIFLCVCA